MNYTAYRLEVDPDFHHESGDVARSQDYRKKFSHHLFNLLELEAKILQYGSVAELASMISKMYQMWKVYAGMPVCITQAQIYFSIQETKTW